MIPAGKPLNGTQVQVINWIYHRWLDGHGFPTPTQFKNRFPEFDLKESMQHDIFLKALHNRGIEPGRVSEELTNEQLAAIRMVSDVNDPRSRQAKLKSLGISNIKWQGWLKDKSFKNYLHAFSASNFEDNVHVAYEGLMKAVDKGSVDAFKIYMEMTGRYTPQSQEIVNIKMILARVIEAIQKHVRDPEILRAIGNDFELIMAGQQPVSNMVEPPKVIEGMEI